MNLWSGDGEPRGKSIASTSPSLFLARISSRLVLLKHCWRRCTKDAVREDRHSGFNKIFQALISIREFVALEQNCIRPLTRGSSGICFKCWSRAFLNVFNEQSVMLRILSGIALKSLGPLTAKLENLRFCTLVGAEVLMCGTTQAHPCLLLYNTSTPISGTNPSNIFHTYIIM